MKDNKIRLQKHLSACGIASRRKAEELIESGKVRVNGRIATLGDKVDPKRDKVTVRGKNVVAVTEKVYIMVNKPRGYVTTMSDEYDRKCVNDLVKDVGVKVFPVGRLDRDSEGLLLMTNDGELANSITHPSRHVNKTYRVTVGGTVTDEQIEKLTTGIMLDGRKTQPCDVFVVERKPDRTMLNFIIHEGRNRQIRRMCEAVGLDVLRLKRLEIAGVKLGGLKLGAWRNLNERELVRLTNISQSKDEEEC
ncbi:MAG: pseudouridine synthase [Acutalibacteraceae bacterium]|nr:pseudouridine synthase [Acutalibacteraceae bacterium]